MHAGLKVLIVLVLLGVAFTIGQGQITGNVVGTESPELTPDEDPQTPERDISINIIQGDFDPNRITVAKGDIVSFHLRAVTIAEGFETHGFSIKEYDISEEVSLGEEKTVTFTADKEGTFVFFCSVFCGQGHIGQAGVLNVV